MKRIYTLLLALFTLAACQDGNDFGDDRMPGLEAKYISRTLEIPTTFLTLSASAQNASIAVTSNSKWTATSSEQWCTVSPTTNALSVSVTENTGATRQATITVTAGDKQKKVTVTQEGVNSYVVNTRTFTVTGNGKTVTFKMIRVEGGTFMMGATDEQGSDASDDEKPAHSVTISKDYYMGETEVTQALWYAVMGQKPTSDGSQWSSSYGLGDSRPAYHISWNDCTQFFTTLNQKLADQLGSGEQFRFPTEAEWEFAARGGNKSKGYKYAGSNTIDDVAWYTVNSNDKGSSSPDYGTHDVGTKAPNELGLYDMSGNVWEWCQDWYNSSYYSSSPTTDPTGPTTGSNRVFRGGCWDINARYCRVSFRNNWHADYRIRNLGLRLALQ